MRKTFKKGHLMEALLVLVGVAALFSTVSGNLQVQENTSTSITTYSTTTTATSYTLTTVLSTIVSTVSATFLSTTSGWAWAASYTSNIATFTNIVAQSSIMTYPVVTVFISVSAVTISISSWFDPTYFWILAVGIGLSAVVVLIVLVLVKLSPSPAV